MLAVRLGRAPSQLLLPLAFGAHAGSLLALTGTPVNVIVSDAAADAGVGRFGFFEFALVGVPLVAGTIAIVWLFGERLLPDRAARSITRDFSDHARTLIEQYRLEHAEDALLTRTSGVAEIVVPPRSELAGERVFAGHGHRQRRPHRARRAAAGRGAERRVRAGAPATRCWYRGPGATSTGISTTSSWSIRRSSCGGRCRWATARGGRSRCSP